MTRQAVGKDKCTNRPCWLLEYDKYTVKEDDIINYIYRIPCSRHQTRIGNIK